MSARLEGGKGGRIRILSPLQYCNDIISWQYLTVRSLTFSTSTCVLLSQKLVKQHVRGQSGGQQELSLFFKIIIYFTNGNQWSVDSVTEAAMLESFKPKLVESKGHYLWSHELLHEWLKGRAGFITNGINSLCWLSSILMDILLM